MSGGVETVAGMPGKGGVGVWGRIKLAMARLREAVRPKGQVGGLSTVSNLIPVLVCQIVYDGRRAELVHFLRNRMAILFWGKPFVDRVTVAAMWRTIHRRDRRAVKAAVDALLAGRTIGRLSIRLRCHLGNIVWFDPGMTVVDRGPGWVRIQFNAVDINAEGRAVQELRESRQWTDALINEIPLAVGGSDVNGRYFYNRNLADMFSLPASGGLPEDWLAAIHPDDQKRVTNEFLEAATEQRSVRIEYRVVRPDQSTRYVIGTADSRFDTKGRFVGTVGTATDVTEFRAIERELRDTSQRLEALIGNLPGTVYRARHWLGGRDYLYLSDRFSEQFGMPAQEFMAMSCAERFKILTLERPTTSEEYWANLATGGEKISRMRLARRDGSLVWLEFRERMVDRIGDDIYVEGIVLDVTEQEEGKRALLAVRRRFEDLVTMLPVGVFEDDLKTGDQFVNEAWLRFVGSAGRDGTPVHWMTSLHLDDRDRVAAQWAFATEHLEPFAAECRIVRADGLVLWTLVHATPRFGPDGQFVSYLGTFTDVTRIKELEHELRDTVTRLRATLDNLPGVVFRMFCTPKRVELLYTSEGTTGPAGMEALETLNSPAATQAARVHEDDVPTIRQGLERLLAEGRFTTRIRIYRADGSLYWAEIRASVIETRGGGALCDGMVLDVTEEMEAKQELERREAERQRLERHMLEARKLESLGQLAGGIAHDFNNLLGAIFGFAQFITEDVGADHPAIEHAHRILSAADRGKELVEQILAFARQTGVERRRISLSDIVKDAEPLIRVAVPSSITINVDAAADTRFVQADRSQLGQILMNLCLNARDAFDGDNGNITVSITNLPAYHLLLRQVAARSMGSISAVEVWREEDGTVWGVAGSVAVDAPHAAMSVRDTGIGMDERVVSRAFEPFFTTKTVGKGTGLGLSVVHGITLAHQGAIIIQSRPGEGTEVTVIFPLVEAETSAAGPIAETRAVGPTGRVMVVDDDQDFGDMVSILMSRQGWTVTHYNDPTAAFTAFQDKPGDWDLVVTDQTMPGLRGQDLIGRIKPMRPELPCILCSGYDDALDEAYAKRIGAATLVRKPMSVAQLMTVVAEVMKSHGI